jgi:predicted Zn-dependent peptidase
MLLNNRTARLLLAAIAATTLLACEKNEEEAKKFPRADDNVPVEASISDLVSYKLDNGVTVFMQEDHSEPNVAIEVFYQAGFSSEPKGQVQVSHITEHAVVFSGTDKLKPNEAPEKIRDFGYVNAEAVGNYVHFDYLVSPDHIADALEIESDHLANARFDEKTLKEQEKKAASEIKNVLGSERGTLKKFGLITLLHAVNHGETNVPIEAGNFQRTVEEVTQFHDARYRVNDMIISIVGDLKIDDAKVLVQKYFGEIAPEPDPPVYQTSIKKNMAVRWDIGASVEYFVYPGPYETYKDRLILAMFGSYLNQYLMYNPEIPSLARGTYVSNPSYPVGPLPFFVFVQPAKYRSLSDVRQTVVGLIDAGIQSVDEKMFSRMKASVGDFIASSLIETEAGNPKVDHRMVLGQHAINLGIKYMFKEGRTDEEFAAVLDGVTLDDMKATLDKYLADSKRMEVMIVGD